MSEPRYRRSAAALTRTVGSEVLLASPRHDAVDVLPGTAAAVWELLNEPASAPELSRELSSLFGVGAERVAEDIAPLLEELVERGWLERVA
jgi:hypothetical protein